MEMTDFIPHLLRWNVAEMHRRFFFPQAYADPLKVAEEREAALELRSILIRTNLREIHDRSLRLNGNVVFGFAAPLSIFNYLKYNVRHMELAINARVQYKIKESEQKVYVVILPWIPNRSGLDADAFGFLMLDHRKWLLYASVVFWLGWSFVMMICMLEGPRWLFLPLGIHAGAYVVVYVGWLLGNRIYLNRWLASLETLTLRDGEEGFL